MTRSRRIAVAAVGLIAVAVVVVGLTVAVVNVTGLAGSRPADPPMFVEEAQAAGLVHAYDGGFDFFVGGGVAAFDCDDDGRPELYLAGGSQEAALFRNVSERGSLRFEPIGDPVTDLDRVTGAYPLDVDGDGALDLAVLRHGENVMLRGLGDCRFERANETWGIDGGDVWTTAFSATWEGTQGRPTLAFGDYLELDTSGKHTGRCEDHQLFRPTASGGYGAPITLTPGYCALSMLFSDWGRTGRYDLRVSNDRHYYLDGEEQLWQVAPTEMPRLYGREDGWERVVIWGMGIASQDLTGDGKPEVYLTSQGDNKLQTLADDSGRPTYRDIALEDGATAHRPFAGDTILPSTAWHDEFADVNNDGFMDLFVSKGNVEAQVEYAMEDPSNLLIGDGDGTFTEGAEAAGIVSFSRGRGAAIVDLDLDGHLDIVQVVRRENVKLWRNVGSGDAEEPRPMGGWIAVRPEMDGPNRDAIGAWVEVRSGDRTVVRERTVGGGHVSGQLGWMHFGLGAAERAEVRVTWPGGEVGPWQPIAARAFATITEGADGVSPWQPGD